MKIFSRTKLIFLSLLISGAFLRFYNLNWGAPFYFHPDERNIASSVAQLNFPNHLNPHFFAYGSLPIYTIFALMSIWKVILHNLDPFIQAIIISRIISALLSISTIFLLFYVGKKIKDNTAGFITATLGTFSVGLVQYAHFGTFEMWLTFFGLLFFTMCLKTLQTKKIHIIVLAGITFGILIAIKVSSIPLALLFIFALFYSKNTYFNFYSLMKILSLLLLFIVVSSLIFVITNPYVFIDQLAFINSMQYESSVALGSLHVFYTGEFFSAIPIVFQFSSIYPFLLNPFLSFIFIPSFIYITYLSFRKKNIEYKLLIACYLILFLSQAFLFAKWTRYMIPTLPFMYLIIACGLKDFLSSIKATSNERLFVILFYISSSIIYVTAFVITVYSRQYSTIAASIWASKNIPSNAHILSEVYDLGIVPFNQYFPYISLFNFYDLDNGNTTRPTLDTALKHTDYIILPSQRIMKTRLLNKNRFPVGNDFYTKLFDGSLGFQKIYETPCDFWCKIIYTNNPAFSFEQTANVFDRPEVYIFKKEF